MKTWVLASGDAISLLVVTLVGFGSHGEFSMSFVPRMAAAFLPLCAGWFLLAPWFHLFDLELRPAAAELWRPAFVMLFAGPLAATVRGILLGTPVIPSFAIVLSVTSALGLVIWRGVYMLAIRQTEVRAG